MVKDKSAITYIVEMQLSAVSGFDQKQTTQELL
jgi:hypothetical protein